MTKKKKATEDCNHCKSLDELTSENHELTTKNNTLELNSIRETQVRKTIEDLITYKDKKIVALEERLRDVNGQDDIW